MNNEIAIAPPQIIILKGSSQGCSLKGQSAILPTFPYSFTNVSNFIFSHIVVHR